MPIYLDEVRDTIRGQLLAACNSYTDTAVDRAFQAAVNKLFQEVKPTMTTATAAIVGSVASFQVGTIGPGTANPPDFRPERIIQARIQYLDAGTWNVAGTYFINQLVTDTDSRYYVCSLNITGTSVGTVSQPPNNQYWQSVPTKMGYPVDHVDMKKVLGWLNHWQGGTNSNPALMTYYWDYSADNPSLRPWWPNKIGFDTINTGFIFPMPTQQWILWMQYVQNPVAFEAGTSNDPNILINLPPEYLYPVLTYLAPAILQVGDPMMQKHVGFMMAQGDAELKRLRGLPGLDSGPFYKDRNTLI